MALVRAVQVVSSLAFHRMTDGFSTHGMRGLPGFALDPFVNLDNFIMTEPTFPPHPHAGFSAITYMFEDSEGAFINRDSLGDRSRIEPGAIHWTQAASGMMHEEVPEYPNQKCHGLQMFVNLRAEHKKAPPRAFHVAASDVPVVTPQDNVRIRVLAGEYGGVRSPLDQLLTKVTWLEVHLDDGSETVIPLDPTHTAFAFVVSGEGFAGPADSAKPVSANTGVGFAKDGAAGVRLASTCGPLQVLLCAGQPIGEPVVSGGPFIMTSDEEIRHARERFSRGDMGHLE